MCPSLEITTVCRPQDANVQVFAHNCDEHAEKQIRTKTQIWHHSHIAVGQCSVIRITAVFIHCFSCEITFTSTENQIPTLFDYEYFSKMK